MNQKSRIITETAMAIALSVVLNFLPLWRMPQGGSVTLSMLPLFIVAFRHGGFAGILAGLGSGFFQFIFGGYIVHPVQIILDYPLAFALVGLAGLFYKFIHSVEEKNQILWVISAMVVATLFRYIAHIISGVIFFRDLAPEGQNVFLYSIIYNGSFLLPALILCIIIIIPLRRLIFNKF